MTTHLRYTSRRTFLRNGLVAGAMLPLVGAGLADLRFSPSSEKLKVYIFSKHLQFLNYGELADAAASMGFDGVDLTVRPNGHVQPERVTQDLPRAAEALKKNGMGPLMMTTAVDDASDTVDKQVLTTASSLGFRYYRMNWLPYPDNISMPEALNQYAQRIKRLGELNKETQLIGSYQNHAGKLVGASLWELWHVLKEADPQYMGVQYDIRHAMVEGATSWENGLRLVAPQIKCLTMKDFKWKQEGSRWVVQDVPVGEGTVDFKSYFRLLKKYRINVPVSLHIEYPLGGVEHGASKIGTDRKKVFDYMKRDLQKIHQLWAES